MSMTSITTSGGAPVSFSATRLAASRVRDFGLGLPTKIAVLIRFSIMPLL